MLAIKVLVICFLCILLSSGEVLGGDSKRKGKSKPKGRSKHEKEEKQREEQPAEEPTEEPDSESKTLICDASFLSSSDQHTCTSSSQTSPVNCPSKACDGHPTCQACYTVVLSEHGGASTYSKPTKVECVKGHRFLPMNPYGIKECFDEKGVTHQCMGTCTGQTECKTDDCS